MQPKHGKVTLGSVSAKCLEATWSKLRTLLPELPRVVIIPSDSFSRKGKRGHFAAWTWRNKGRRLHEISISPDLFDSAEELLATLLHEAGHAILYGHAAKGEKHLGGCGPDGYYHRKEFRDTCEDLGLECRWKNGRYGWTITDWPKRGVPSQYSKILDYLKQHATLGTGPCEPIRIRRGRMPGSGHTRLVCKCKKEPRSVYVSRAVSIQGGIICALCGAAFSRVKAAPADEAKGTQQKMEDSTDWDKRTGRSNGN